MANYSAGNFLKDPVSGDTLMYVYNTSLVLSLVIDPYSSTFEKNGTWIFIITDGKISYTNSLDFGSSGEADLALARLNDVKRIILSWLGTTLENCYQKSENLIPSQSGAYDLGSTEYTFKDIYLTGDLFLSNQSTSDIYYSKNGGTVNGYVSATTYYGDGSNLTDVVDVYGRNNFGLHSTDTSIHFTEASFSGNYLSANTSFYTQDQVYTKEEANSNFLSANTSLIMGLGDLSDVTISDEVKKGGILTYSDVNGGTWVDQYNVVLGDGSSVSETQYEAGASVEIILEINPNYTHTTTRRGAQLTLKYPYDWQSRNRVVWDSSLLVSGAEIIDPTLTYRLQVVGLDGSHNEDLVVNAMSETDAIAFADLYPSDNTGPYGLCLAVPVVINHLNTVILGDNITATDDNSLNFEKGKIYEHNIEAVIAWGDVLDDSTLLSNMVSGETDRYLVYDATGLTIFNEGDIIGFKKSNSIDYWLFTIVSIDEVDGETYVWVTETHGTVATAFDDSDWETFAVTITSPAYSHTALNIGTGNTISHNNSHIIGNNINTDAADTLFVDNLKADKISMNDDAGIVIEGEFIKSRAYADDDNSDNPYIDMYEGGFDVYVGNTNLYLTERIGYLAATYSDNIQRKIGVGNSIYFIEGTKILNFDLSSLSANRVFKFPDADGTFALMSDIPVNYINPDVAENWMILRDIDPASTGNTYKIQISGGTIVANLIS